MFCLFRHFVKWWKNVHFYLFHFYLFHVPRRYVMLNDWWTFSYVEWNFRDDRNRNMKHIYVIFVIIYCTVFIIFYDEIIYLLYEFMMLIFDNKVFGGSWCLKQGVLIEELVKMSACLFNSMNSILSTVSFLIIFLPKKLFAFGLPSFDKVIFRTCPAVVNFATSSIIFLLWYSFITSYSFMLSSFGGEW